MDGDDKFEVSSYDGDHLLIRIGEELDLAHKPARKSRVALFKDDVRLRIIKEIFKLPAIWDNNTKEPMSIAQRKQAFSEIASRLRNHENGLRAIDVERQWKNLKDTYIKVKKKALMEAENGTYNVPKWKFFRVLSFIDSEELHTFDIDKEISEVKSGNCYYQSPIPVPKTQVTHPVTTRKVVQPSSSNVAQHPDLVPTVTPFRAVDDTHPTDEYTTFCNSLIHPMREIGAYSKLEYYKIQKVIRDALFDVQMRLHTDSQ